MHKVKNIFSKIKNWSLRKKIFFFVLILVLGFFSYKIWGPKDNSANIITDTVKNIDLKKTVLATGQVTSKTDLNLSFNRQGTVQNIFVSVGDKVKKGQTLVKLDGSSLYSDVLAAKGNLAQAKARLKKILEGATSEEITLAKIALENAKKDLENTKNTQATLVSNAHKNLLNSYPEAVSTSNGLVTAPEISGFYKKDIEGDIIINIFNSGNGLNYSIAGIANDSGILNINVAEPIGDTGLYFTFESSANLVGTNWIISLPNTSASNYLTNINAYESAKRTETSALSSASSLVSQREAELALKLASARPSDVELAEADILSAEAGLQKAQSAYNDSILTAPADGTITFLDVKLGELVQALKGVVILQDVSNLYLESYINEANIASITLGSKADFTFDAFGSEKNFTGKIEKIEPSSTLISGVVNYKVLASIDTAPDIKPGMTANMTILVSSTDAVNVVPARAIIQNKDGSKILRTITDSKKKTYTETVITTGLEGDGGLVEVTSPILPNQEFVVLIKK